MKMIITLVGHVHHPRRRKKRTRDICHRHQNRTQRLIKMSFGYQRSTKCRSSIIQSTAKVRSSSNRTSQVQPTNSMNFDEQSSPSSASSSSNHSSYQKRLNGSLRNDPLLTRGYGRFPAASSNIKS